MKPRVEQSLADFQDRDGDVLLISEVCARNSTAVNDAFRPDRFLKLAHQVRSQTYMSSRIGISNDQGLQNLRGVADLSTPTSNLGYHTPLFG